MLGFVVFDFVILAFIARNEPKMGPKLIPNGAHNGPQKWARDQAQNGPSAGPKNGAENDSKMCPKWTQNGAQNGPGLGPENGQAAAEFSCCVFENLATNQARILAQNPAQNGAQNGPRMDPK